MPQGRAKKIQVKLLLADLSLQFFDPTLPRARRSLFCAKGGNGAANADAPFDGRPIDRNAAAPPDRYRLCQSYSNSGRTLSSSARALTLTASLIRDTADSLNSRDQRRFVLGSLLGLNRFSIFPDKQCASFSCLSSGVQSTHQPQTIPVMLSTKER